VVVPPAPLSSETWFSTVLRMAVYALTAGVFAWPLAVDESAVAAACGGALGPLCARFLARGPLRTGSLAALVALSLLGVAAVGALATDTDALAAWLGPARAMRLGDALVFGLGAFVVSAGLRALAARVRVLGALEVAVVALAFAELVAAHRDGAINRPFELADPVLARGEDPSVYLLGLGAVASGVLVVLLLGERHAARAVLSLAVLFGLLGVLLSLTGGLGLPRPPATGRGLGLRDDDGEGSTRGSGGRGEGRGTPGRDEGLEFRDDYAASARKVPVAVVLLEDDFTPPTGAYYFRQSAFSEYNGRRLVAATDGDVDRDIAREFPIERTPILDAPAAGVFRSNVRSTVALLADHTRPFGLESIVELAPVRNPDPARFVRTYQVTSHVLTADYAELFGVPTGSPAWSSAVRAHYTRAPTDPRYAELLGRILADLPEALRDDGLARALAITRWLSKQGTYSLRSRHADAEDPTADFLFGDLTGYCVHFAHAAVYLMRLAGVPARVATGYLIDESTRQGGSAVLVTGDASHAWPEVYLEAVGWVVVDVAVERALDPPPGPPDPDLQRLLGELARGLRPLPRDGGAPARSLVATVRRGAQLVLRVVGAAFALVLAVLYAAKLWRRLVARIGPQRSRPRTVYRAVLDALCEAGFVRERGLSREGFAARLAGTVPSLEPLTRVHLAATFGGRAASRDELDTLAAAARRELRRAVPAWRRALGLLDPTVVLRVR
jgi:transglutaminase-like putative cysteine protease